MGLFFFNGTVFFKTINGTFSSPRRAPPPGETRLRNSQNRTRLSHWLRLSHPSHSSHSSQSSVSSLFPFYPRPRASHRCREATGLSVLGRRGTWAWKENGLRWKSQKYLTEKKFKEEFKRKKKKKQAPEIFKEPEYFLRFLLVFFRFFFFFSDFLIFQTFMEL